MDLGCYPLHAMRTLTGKEPEIIEAIHTRAENGVAVSSWAEMHLGDTSASLDCNMGRDAIYDNSLHIIGSKGVAKLSGFVHPYRWDPQLGFDIYVEVNGEREFITLYASR